MPPLSHLVNFAAKSDMKELDCEEKEKAGATQDKRQVPAGKQATARCLTLRHFVTPDSRLSTLHLHSVCNTMNHSKLLHHQPTFHGTNSTTRLTIGNE